MREWEKAIEGDRWCTAASPQSDHIVRPNRAPDVRPDRRPDRAPDRGGDLGPPGDGCHTREGGKAPHLSRPRTVERRSFHRRPFAHESYHLPRPRAAEPGAMNHANGVRIFIQGYIPKSAPTVIPSRAQRAHGGARDRQSGDEAVSSTSGPASTTSCTSTPHLGNDVVLGYLAHATSERTSARASSTRSPGEPPGQGGRARRMLDHLSAAASSSGPAGVREARDLGLPPRHDRSERYPRDLGGRIAEFPKCGCRTSTRAMTQVLVAPPTQGPPQALGRLTGHVVRGGEHLELRDGGPEGPGVLGFSVGSIPDLEPVSMPTRRPSSTPSPSGLRERQRHGLLGRLREEDSQAACSTPSTPVSTTSRATSSATTTPSPTPPCPYWPRSSLTSIWRPSRR